jgi:hypothetical protein
MFALSFVALRASRQHRSLGGHIPARGDTYIYSTTIRQQYLFSFEELIKLQPETKRIENGKAVMIKRLQSR